MFYWLFKRYMKRFTLEYKAKFLEELERTQDPRMTPNWFWVEELLFPDKKEK